MEGNGGTKNTITRLRVIAICSLVLFFIFILVLIKIAADRWGVGGGSFPLLELAKGEAVVDGRDVDRLNKFLGKRKVLLRDTVQKVTATPNGGYILHLSHSVIILDPERVQLLLSKGVQPTLLKGLLIQAEGILRLDPNYGIRLFLLKGTNVQVLGKTH